MDEKSTGKGDELSPHFLSQYEETDEDVSKYKTKAQRHTDPTTRKENRKRP